jgi:hypothetical protein
LEGGWLRMPFLEETALDRDCCEFVQRVVQVVSILMVTLQTTSKIQSSLVSVVRLEDISSSSSFIL